LAERAISTALDEFEERQFVFRISQDPIAYLSFADEIGSTDNHPLISTIFDPAYNYLGPGNFLWTSVHTDEGEPAAIVATRSIDGDLEELIRTGRLWGTKRPVQVPSTMFVYPNDAPRLTGVTVYRGGMYVRAKFRNCGIARPLVQATVALCDRLFRPEWHFAFRFADISRQRLRLFGYDECFPVFRQAHRKGLDPQRRLDRAET
jgi:GNAT superfamily N-acetyltransferase